MTTATIKGTPGAEVFSPFCRELARTSTAVAAGWRAARDWRRLSVRTGGLSRAQIAREVFERNFG